MAVRLDNHEAGWCFPSGRLLADSFDELREFGRRIGLPDSDLKQSAKGVWHYRVGRIHRRMALRAGAIRIRAVGAR